MLLGFDTSTSATAVGLRLAGGSSLEARDDPQPGAHPGHATRLLELAGGLLAEAGIGFGDLQRIAVGAGPGTFTGLRVGVATARGLAQSLELELVAVSSLQALARGATASGGAHQGPVLAAIDARRGELFVAVYDGERVVLAPRAIAPGALGEMLERDGLSTPGSPGLPAVGDGALRYRAELEFCGLQVPPEDSPLHLLRAAQVCALGLDGAGPTAFELALPDYCRRPDAELTLEAAGAGEVPV